MTIFDFEVPIYVQASLMGILRSVGGFPLEHPFDFIKTKHQAQMNLAGAKSLNELQIMRQVYA